MQEQAQRSRCACLILVGINAHILLQGSHFQADAEDTHGDLQLLDLEIGGAHDGHDHGVDADNLAVLVVLDGDLGLAVGTEQVSGGDSLGQAV